MWYNLYMQIRQIVRVSDQGVSRPYQCYDEAGVLRWCKGNHTGIRSLLSEWICARVAQRLGIPVPACDILRLDPSRFQDWARCRGGCARAAEFAAEVRGVITERFLDEVWAEMPVAWTEAGCEMLTLEIVKDVLLREDF